MPKKAARRGSGQNTSTSKASKKAARTEKAAAGQQQCLKRKAEEALQQQQDDAFWQVNTEVHDKLFGESDDEHELSPFTQALTRRYCPSCKVLCRDEEQCVLGHECANKKKHTPADEFTPAPMERSAEGELTSIWFCFPCLLSVVLVQLVVLCVACFLSRALDTLADASFTEALLSLDASLIPHCCLT